MVKYVICHVIDSLGVGGAQSMLFELYKAIEKHYPDFEQNVILLDESKIDRDFVKSNIINHNVMNPSMFRQILSNFKIPVIVVYHKLFSSDVTAYAKLFGKYPIVVINHTYTENPVHINIASCNVVVSVSKHMAQVIKRVHPKKNIVVIRNGVNGSRFIDVKAQDRIRDGRLITGRINALNKRKHSNKWLEWLYSVDLPFILEHDYIGVGNYYSRAKDFAEKGNTIHKNKINILGLIPNFTKKVEIIKSWDLFTYEVYEHEGISMSILEALACGVPVICSNHYGNKEIIKNGVNGYVYSGRAELKSLLMDLGTNPGRLQSLKESTRKHFNDNLDAKYMTSEYIKLFLSFINVSEKTKSL